jgi:hypothetical protein
MSAFRNAPKIYAGTKQFEKLIMVILETATICARKKKSREKIVMERKQ